MKKLIQGLRLSALAAGLFIASAVGANAQLFSFTNGDVILGFQATSGTGSTQNVFFNLGSGVDFRNGTTQGILGNINNTLTSVFGNDWFTRDDIYVGAFGNLNFGPNPGSASPPPQWVQPVDGDPSRTLYLSGNSTHTMGNSAGLGQAGLAFSNIEAYLPTLAAQGDGAAILDSSSVNWANSWSNWNPVSSGVQGTAFNTVTGGIQSQFGQGGDTLLLNIQRMVPNNNSADPGYIVSSIGIGADGSIFVIPEPSTWLLLGLGFAMALFQMRRRRVFNA